MLTHLLLPELLGLVVEGLREVIGGDLPEFLGLIVEDIWPAVQCWTKK